MIPPLGMVEGAIGKVAGSLPRRGRKRIRGREGGRHANRFYYRNTTPSIKTTKTCYPCSAIGTEWRVVFRWLSELVAISADTSGSPLERILRRTLGGKKGFHFPAFPLNPLILP